MTRPSTSDKVLSQARRVLRRSSLLMAAAGRRVGLGGGNAQSHESTVSSPVEAAPSADETAIARAREEASALREAKRPAQGVEVLRRALADYGMGDGSLWTLYAQRLIEVKKYDAAYEAMKFAVDIDASNMEALELLVEMKSSRNEKVQGIVTRALSRCAEDIHRRPGRHRDALHHFVPARHAAGLEALRRSDDEVVKVAMALIDAKTTHTDVESIVEGVDEATADRARLHVALANGSVSQAVSLLEELPPAAIPVYALRVTIRRFLRMGRNKPAHRLLKQYLRARPEDAWAKSNFAATREKRAAGMTNYQLGKVGFPMPPLSAQPLYEPHLDRSLYMLHNSLPYHSAGYATRTHGLLSQLRHEGWAIDGVTRLGYPYDMPGRADLGPIPEVDQVGPVPYRRLSTEPHLEVKNPIQEYVARYSKALRALAQRERPFVLHAASNHWNGLTAVATARRLGIPSVYEVRGLWEVTRGSRDPVWARGGMFRYMARMEADAAKYATRVIAITSALRDELVDRGVDAEKITLVHNGVDTDRFQPRERNEELAAQLGMSGKTVIGYVGSVLDYEGLGLLVDAAAALSEERNDFAVLVVGDGAELDQFRDRVAEEGLEEVVHFIGRVPHDEVEDYYSVIDIAPFPRLPLPVCEMVSPLKPFEALAMGKAVVASDVSALAEIIQDGVNGLTHRKGDDADLTRKLRMLLDDPELRRRLAHDGREWVVAERQWSHLATRISNVYEEIGGKRS